MNKSLGGFLVTPLGQAEKFLEQVDALWMGLARSPLGVKVKALELLYTKFKEKWTHSISKSRPPSLHRTDYVIILEIGHAHLG